MITHDSTQIPIEPYNMVFLTSNSSLALSSQIELYAQLFFLLLARRFEKEFNHYLDQIKIWI